MRDSESYPEILDRLFPAGFADPEVRESLATLTGAPRSDFEAADLMGRCLWDIFSDNHEVIDPDGGVIDLGSFRGSGDTLAAFGTARARVAGLDWRWGYLDFYMGTGPADRPAAMVLHPILFRRLRAHDLHWRYSHPRFYQFDFGGPPQPESDQWPDPSATVARGLADQKREAEVRALRESLDEAYRESVREAQSEPPPDIVVAYSQVYGRWPHGWPPSLGAVPP